MKQRFSFIRRAKVRYAPVSPASEQAAETPAAAAPEHDLRTHMEIPEVAQVPDQRSDVVSAKGFTPLPRCGRCGTAVAFSQVICHGCGGGLRGL